MSGKIETLLEREFGEQLKASGTNVALLTQPLTDIHLHSKRFGETNGDIVYVYGFSAVAILILLIACINYMNLATARSTRRAREVGMRKVLGAVRTQISRQFFGESALVTLCAILLSLGLVHFFLNHAGDEDPIGQTIIVNSNREYEVTGVIQDLPKNSHLQFDFIASYVSLTASWARNV